MVRPVIGASGRDRRRSRSCGSIDARRTFPFEVACSGVLRPTQLTATTERVPVT
jgi:hypothetical protein